MNSNALNKWEEMKQASQLATKAREEIRETLDKNYLNASLLATEQLNRLKQQELESRLRNQQAQAEYYRNQVNNLFDTIRNQNTRNTYSPVVAQSNVTNMGTGISLSDLENMMKEMGKAGPSVPKPPKKDLSGLKNLLNKADNVSK